MAPSQSCPVVCQRRWGKEQVFEGGQTANPLTRSRSALDGTLPRVRQEGRQDNWIQLLPWLHQGAEVSKSRESPGDAG